MPTDKHILQTSCKTLTKAFLTNKSVNYVVKQDKQKENRIHALMKYSYLVCERWGKVYSNEKKNAFALVLFPHKKKYKLKDLYQDVYLVVKSFGLGKVGKVLQREGIIKKFHPKEPFCYLWFAGVEPSEQGKGIGTKLLLDVLNDAKANNLPVYLETSTLANLPLYKRLGFEIYQELDFGFTCFCMRKN